MRRTHPHTIPAAIAPCAIPAYAVPGPGHSCATASPLPLLGAQVPLCLAGDDPPGFVLVRNLYLSYDPYMRPKMSRSLRESYTAAFARAPSSRALASPACSTPPTCASRLGTSWCSSGASRRASTSTSRTWAAQCGSGRRRAGRTRRGWTISGAVVRRWSVEPGDGRRARSGGAGRGGDGPRRHGGLWCGVQEAGCGVGWG